MEDFTLHLGDYRKKLSHVKANLIFTSPPYNIGSKSKRIDGRRKFGKYDPKSYGAITGYSDSLPEDEYQDQQEEFFLWCADHLSDSGVLVYNHKPRRNGRMILPAEWFLRKPVFDRLKLMEEIVWDRGSTHNHSNNMMWPTTERLYVFRKTESDYRLLNHDGLKFRNDVWRIPRAPSNGHNAPFPMELALSVISAWSNEGDLVCDPYSGSGTTAIASLSLGRRFEGTEVLSKYHKLAIDRIGFINRSKAC